MNPNATQPIRYSVVVRGRLGRTLADAFDYLEVESRSGESSLTGTFADRAQLHGLLDRLRDLGIEIVSVNPVADEATPTLVLGGTGKTGRRVAERLAARGLPVRIGSRSGGPPFDWDDRSTWPAALEGVKAAYVSYYPDLTMPGAVEAAGSFAELAVRSGVRRLLLLSGRGEPEAEDAERAVRDSGAELTILRSAWFAQNFSENYMLEYVLGGEVALPAGDVPEPFVDVDDIADVAVAALTEGGHAGRLYELTGPRALTFAEAVDEISRAVGREIRYVPISIEEFVDAAYQDVPREFVELLTYLFGEVLDGRNAHVADGVERALGRRPRDFAEYARATAARGIWGRQGLITQTETA